MPWTMQQMMDLATGYWRAAALGAGVELGLFERLSREPLAAEELARSVGAAPRQTAALLRALAGMGVLRERDGRFEIAPEAAPFLRTDSPTCLIEALRFNRDLYPVWGALAESVRHGAPAVPPAAHLGGDPARTRRFVLGMHSRAGAMAAAIAPAVALPERGPLLDVGSGPGTFSRRLAEERSGLRVTQFDLPPVLEVARELTSGSPAADRIAFHPGDYRRDPLPPAGAILFCGALHQETPASAAALFAKMRSALPAGAPATVIDLMVEEGGARPVFAALFSLNMMLFNPSAGVFEVCQTETLLRDAGFREVASRPIPDLPYYAVTARV